MFTRRRMGWALRAGGSPACGLLQPADRLGGERGAPACGLLQRAHQFGRGRDSPACGLLQLAPPFGGERGAPNNKVLISGVITSFRAPFNVFPVIGYILEMSVYVRLRLIVEMR